MALVVGIDPSLTSTGIAALSDGRPVLLRSIGHGSRNGTSYAHRSDRIVSQARAVLAAIETGIRTQQPDLAVIEGPAYAHANAYTHDCAGLWWGLYSGLRARKIPISVIAPTTRAKWATGTGRADKRAVLDAVRTTWKPWAKLITNDDIADALTLAEAAARHLDDPLHFPPRRRHIEALHTITWPTESRPA
ncbi:crossover junction endodeoxyribonuclease RuvC [Mycobacterium malmoense]|uniref:crossover junction endodeoxyribonuclease RuvC n=1 Tax=Mycobacterium malmoense TaxID=1780 RepID=UPI0008F8C2EB|nr:crossover junction endodeoxyribonuclease RuvC [Mycobacterium malmoense]OIN81646.1 hypothetical protein BMG05_06500 [Mycobacterium malmoense]